MAERILDIQGYTGGEADTLERGPANSFYQGENIEVRKNLTGFELSPKLTDTGWIIDGDILFMESLETLGVNNGGIVICTDTGKIYLNGVLKHTLSTGTTAYNKIQAFGVNQNIAGVQYVYYVSQTSSGQGKIHRSTTNLATFNEQYRTFNTSSGNPDKAHIINNVGLMYIGIKNIVFIMDKDEIVLDYLILPEKEEIRGMSMYLGNFRIYANSGNTGIQYLWDGASQLPYARQEKQNQPVFGIVNDGATDYAVMGFNEQYSDLYRIDGTQFTELRVNLEASMKSRVLGSYLSLREGIVYISGGKSGESQNYGIYTYGNYFPGTQISLVQSYSLSSNSFLHHSHGIAKSYFACNDDKIYSIEHGNPASVYAENGYIVSLMYDGGAIWETLSLDRFKVSFKTNGGTIKISARTSSSDTFTLIKTISSGQYGSVKHCYVSVNELVTNGISLGQFEEIQFKYELERSAGVSSTTPILKRFTAWFKINNNS